MINLNKKNLTKKKNKNLKRKFISITKNQRVFQFKSI